MPKDKNTTKPDRKAKNQGHHIKGDKEHKKGMTELVNKATLGKMLSFVIMDWPLLLLGVTFLIGAAVAQIFLPLLTGIVISGKIIVTNKEHMFLKNLNMFGKKNIIFYLYMHCSKLTYGELLYTR